MFCARSWQETPCTIVSSKVGHHSGGKGPTFSVKIIYRYDFNRREYQSNRYGIMGHFSSSGSSGKAEIVERYPAGSKSVCFVNPADPTESLLDRSITANILWGLLGLIFAVVGFLWLLGLLRAWRHDSRGSPSGSPDGNTSHAPL